MNLYTLVGKYTIGVIANGTAALFKKNKTDSLPIICRTVGDNAFRITIKGKETYYTQAELASIYNKFVENKKPLSTVIVVDKIKEVCTCREFNRKKKVKAPKVQGELQLSTVPVPVPVDVPVVEQPVIHSTIPVCSSENSYCVLQRKTNKISMGDFKTTEIAKEQLTLSAKRTPDVEYSVLEKIGTFYHPGIIWK